MRPRRAMAAVGWLGRRLLTAACAGRGVCRRVSAVRAVPGGFLPDEDQGYFFVNVGLPNGAALVQTQQVVAADRADWWQEPGVTRHDRAVRVQHRHRHAGAECRRDHRHPEAVGPAQRRRPAGASSAELQARFNAIPSATITAFNPPAIPGLGHTGGLDLQMEGRAGQSYPELAATARALIYRGQPEPDRCRRCSPHSPPRCRRSWCR